VKNIFAGSKYVWAPLEVLLHMPNIDQIQYFEGCGCVFKAIEFTRQVKSWARVSLLSFHSVSQIKAKKDWSNLFWILQKPLKNMEHSSSQYWCKSNYINCTFLSWEIEIKMMKHMHIKLIHCLWMGIWKPFMGIVTYSMFSGLLEAYCWMTNVCIIYWVVVNILFGHNIGKLIQWLLACWKHVFFWMTTWKYSMSIGLLGGWMTM
jgi:hypothetical protein